MRSEGCLRETELFKATDFDGADGTMGGEAIGSLPGADTGGATTAELAVGTDGMLEAGVAFNRGIVGAGPIFCGATAYGFETGAVGGANGIGAGTD